MCGCRHDISAIRGRKEGVLALNCLYCLVLKCVSNKYSCSELQWSCCLLAGIIWLFGAHKNCSLKYTVVCVPRPVEMSGRAASGRFCVCARSSHLLPTHSHILKDPIYANALLSNYTGALVYVLLLPAGGYFYAGGPGEVAHSLLIQWWSAHTPGLGFGSTLPHRAQRSPRHAAGCSLRLIGSTLDLEAEDLERWLACIVPFSIALACLPVALLGGLLRLISRRLPAHARHRLRAGTAVP